MLAPNLRNRESARFVPRHAAARRRGSTLLLVIAALLMAMFLGLAYMQIARSDRLGNANLAQADALDQVTQATIDAISAELRSDLGVNDNGTPDPGDDRLFDGSGASVSDEPYDYPGAQDKWLAASAPATTSPYTWSQISLMEFEAAPKYSDNSNIQSNVDAASVPTTPAAINAGGALADADGDGIIDSKFQRAPVASLAGLDFYVAVRIIDNSALVNLNTALPLINNANAYDTNPNSDTSSAPRWWYPSEIDLGGFIQGFTGFALPMATGGSYFDGDLRRLMGYRLGVGPGAYDTSQPMPLGVANGQRTHYWAYGPSLYDNYTSPYQKIGIDAELSLRHRNGLVNQNLMSSIEGKLADNAYAMENLLRTFDGRENVYEVSWDKAAPGVITSIPDYFIKEPRHQLTTISGATIVAPRLTGDPAVPMKVDLNQSSVTAISTEIKKVFEEGTTKYVPPAGYSNDTAGREQAADTLAAAIKDYADTDNKLTEVVNGTSKRYGLERLPFITEVYAQRAYKAVATATMNVNEYSVAWNATGDAGFGIEIRNPYNTSVSLANIDLVINGTAVGKLDALAGQVELGPNEVLVFYQNSVGGDATADNVAALIDATTPAPVALAYTWPTADPVTVELRAMKQDNVQCDWGYSKVTATVGMPDPGPTEVVTSATNPNDTLSYKQAGGIGNGEKFKMMTVLPGGYNAVTNTGPAVGVSHDPTIDNLGQTAKANQPAGAGVDLTKVQLLFREDPHGMITEVGEIGQIAFVPLDGTKTFAEAWAGATDAQAYMLNFGGAVAGTGDLALPHAMLLLDRFTTISPYEDGVDNDNDASLSGDTDELFVPGTLNVNTATADVLRFALPLPPEWRNAGDSKDVIKALVDYRDDAAKRPTLPVNYRTGKGFASIGELLGIFNTNTIDNPPAANTTDDRLAANGMLIDFVSNPTATTADGIIDDREEQMMVARMLGQVCSVRSDVYTAYVLVRGYDPSDLTKARAERRVLVVFDRSRVINATTPVRILGYYQF